MENIKVDSKDLFRYTYYDENKKLVVVLNEENIKKIFNADIILLDETEHK